MVVANSVTQHRIIRVICLFVLFFILCTPVVVGTEHIQFWSFKAESIRDVRHYGNSILVVEPAKLTVLDVDGNQEHMEKFDKMVFKVGVSLNTNYTIIVFSDGTVALYHNWIQKWVKDKDMFGNVEKVGVANNGNSFVETATGKIIVLDVDGNVLRTYHKGYAPYYDVAISPDGRLIAAADRNEILWIPVDGSEVVVTKLQQSTIVPLFAMKGKLKFVSNTTLIHAHYKAVSMLTRDQILWKFEEKGIKDAAIGRNLIILKTDKYVFVRDGKPISKKSIKEENSIISVSPNDSKVVIAEPDVGRVKVYNGDGNLLWSDKISVDKVLALDDCVLVVKDNIISAFSTPKTAANIILSKAENMLSSLEEYNVSGAWQLYEEAKSAYLLGDYSLALEYGQGAISKASEIKMYADKAVYEIKQAEKAIATFENKYDMSEAKSMLEEAKTLYLAGMYEQSFEKAKKAASLANDVDQDGTPNSEDVLPQTNNYLLAVPTVLAVLFVIVRRPKRIGKVGENKEKTPNRQKIKHKSKIGVKLGAKDIVSIQKMRLKAHTTFLNELEKIVPRSAIGTSVILDGDSYIVEYETPIKPKTGLKSILSREKYYYGKIKLVYHIRTGEFEIKMDLPKGISEYDVPESVLPNLRAIY